MNKIEAIEALQKEYHYSQILVEDEFIKQDDGTTERNKIYDIADAFNIDMPITTFHPHPSDPKGPMPNHTEECNERFNVGVAEWEMWNMESTGQKNTCLCWGYSYTGIAVMDVVNHIGQLYNVYSGKFGRGFAQREKLERLHQLMTDMMEIPKEKLEEMAKAEEAIKEKTGIIVNLGKDWVSVPLREED